MGDLFEAFYSIFRKALERKAAASLREPENRAARLT
jgi:hypothetical protein